MTTNESQIRPVPEDENTAAALETSLTQAEADEASASAAHAVAAPAFDDLPPLPAFDIDAALAAVSSLDAAMAEREAEEAAERARIAQLEAERQAQLEAQRHAEEERRRWIESYDFQRPPMIVLRRGHPASVIPALLLIGAGAYLTFALTLSQTPPAPGLVALIVGAVVGVTLLANWLASGRWARGSLFAGLTIMLAGAAAFAMTTPGLLPLPEAARWPLVVAALGLAMLLSALLARPLAGRLAAVGLGVTAAGVTVLALDAGWLGTALPALIMTVWPAVLALVGIFTVIALIFRQRA